MSYVGASKSLYVKRMKHPSLALCIPAYNAADFLPRLLKSALAQTIPFDEIWVYDDCSIDGTGKVAAEFGAKVVRGDVNRGCSFGKNTLAQKTSCDWIHFHDADDALYPNFVEQSHKWMLQNKAPDVVLFSYDYRDEATDKLLLVRVFDDLELRRDCIAYTIREQINPFCGLYRQEAFLRAGGYDLDPLVLYNEDVAMHCQLARAGLSFAADPTVTVINYRRSNSMSSANQIKCARAQFHVMRKSAEALEGRYAANISQKLWGIAAVSASYLDWKNADACISLTGSLNGRIPKSSSLFFRCICCCNPYLALRIREVLIRLFKSSFRQEYPSMLDNKSLKIVKKSISWKGTDFKTGAILSYLRGPDHPMKIRLVRTLISKLFSRGLMVQNQLDSRIRVQPHDYIGWSILSNGSYEGETLALAGEILSKNGGAFLDIGANFGLFTCLLGVIPGVECYAIEPCAKNFVLLTENLALNPGIKAKLFNVALDNTHRLFELEDINPSNCGTVRVVLEDRQSNSACYTVAATTLEKLLTHAKVQIITLMKIDVEGYEPLILEGLDWNGNFRPYNVIIEFTDYSSRSKGSGRQSILEFFNKRGYEGRTVNGEPLSLEQNIPEDNAWFRDLTRC